MDTGYNLNLQIQFKIYKLKTDPIIRYGLDNKVIDLLTLDKPNCKVELNKHLDIGNHIFWIEFINKNYDECLLEQNIDMAVEIESVSFEGITLDRFKWAGFYYPDYPENYPDKKPIIESATYLGWNGRWELPFTVPIFTWIHKLENLGWLYEP